MGAERDMSGDAGRESLEELSEHDLDNVLAARTGAANSAQLHPMRLIVR